MNSGAGTVHPLETLSESELRLAKRAKELSGLAGVIIGVLRGEDDPNGSRSWDIRPLIQTPNGTMIVRCSEPGLALHSKGVTARLDTLRATLRAFRDLGLCPAGFQWGEDAASNQLWASRKWYEKGYEPSLTEAELSQFVADLTLIHGGGVGHGHLGVHNIVRENTPGQTGLIKSSRIVMLDPGFAFCASNRPDAGDARAADLKALVELSPASLQARVQSAVTTGRLSGLIISKETNNNKEAAPTFGPAIVEQRSVSQQGQGITQSTGSQTKNLSINRQRQQIMLWIFTVVVIASGAAWYINQAEVLPISEANEFWASGQPSLMARVAEAAINGQKSAQGLIIKSVMAGKVSDQLVKQGMITLAFDPRWEAQLTKTDRSLLLRLALAKIYPEGLSHAPQLSEVHPGILLAVMADIDANKQAGFADSLSLDGFCSLPGEIGASFTALRAAGISRVSNPSARALSRIIAGGHITVGSVVEHDIQTVLAGKGAGSRLRALVPLFASQPKLARMTLTVIAGNSGVLTELLRWLGADPSADWSKAPPQTILSILAGSPPPDLTIEQWADLLSFPEMGMRRSAAVALAQKFLKDESELVTLLASTDVGLSRIQTATLVSALSLPSEERYTLMSRWFEQKPTNEAIKKILLVRGAALLNDGFNLEAARYLSNSAVNFTIPELRRLTQFREPLVRAVAYSHLRIDDPDERKILEECAQQEADQKLRNGLLERLSDFARTQSAMRITTQPTTQK